jgi:hypothetical protein
MINLFPFTILFGAMALIAAALGRFFPDCMLKRPIQGLLYGLAVVLVGVVIFTWIMAMTSRG